MTDHEDALVRTALEDLDEPLPDFENGWPDVLRRAEQESPARRRHRLGAPRWLIGHGHAAIAASVAAAGAIIVATAVIGPWGGGPTLVERAAAAISPSENSILHLRQVQRVEGALDQTESWQLGDPPHAIRVIRGSGADAAETSITATSSGQGAPLGDGTPWVRGRVVGYCPANGTLRTSEGLWSFSDLAIITAVPGSGDPTVRLRAALASGELRDAGRVQLQGQEVVKLVGTIPFGTGPHSSALGAVDVTYFVQPESLLPVRLEWHTTDQAAARADRNAIDFTVAERLPATPENRTLLDVAAQHPGAPVVSAINATTPCS